VITERAQQSGFEMLADYALGNGIGLSLNEQPVVRANSVQKLKEGMCLALRLPVSDKTFGKVMFGSTLIVGKEGVEKIT